MIWQIGKYTVFRLFDNQCARQNADRSKAPSPPLRLQSLCPRIKEFKAPHNANIQKSLLHSPLKKALTCSRLKQRQSGKWL